MNTPNNYDIVADLSALIDVADPLDLELRPPVGVVTGLAGRDDLTRHHIVGGHRDRGIKTQAPRRQWD